MGMKAESIGRRVAASAAVMVIAAAAGWAGGASEQRGGGAQQRTVTVTGEATVSAAPDIAEVSLGIEAYGRAAEDAVATGRKRMQSVLEALSAAGVAERDVQTSVFDLSFERAGGDRELESAVQQDGDSLRGGDAQPAGRYRATNMVHITVREISRVGSVLDGAIAAGANTVHGISFALSEPGPQQLEARAAAVQDARRKARELAQAAGMEVGTVVSIRDTQSSGPQPMGAMERGMGGQSTPIQPGSVSFYSTVEVVYELEPAGF